MLLPKVCYFCVSVYQLPVDRGISLFLIFEISVEREVLIFGFGYLRIQLVALLHDDWVFEFLADVLL